MKKIGFYLLLVLGGIVMGYVIFQEKSEPTAQADQMHDHQSGRWICSMHPQINQQEKGSCPLCAMELVYSDEVGNTLSPNQFKMTESALALANIETSTVDSYLDSELTLQLSGTIATNAETDAVQTILYDGRLDALYSNYIGKKVWKGQEIGKVYSPELYSAQDKLLTSVSYRETHPKLYDAARYTLGLWKMSDEQIEEMIKSGKPLMNFPLYADVSGTVTEVMGHEGSYYKEGEPILKVSDLTKVWAVFDAYEEQLSLLKKGQDIEIFIKALSNKKITGKIDFIEPVLNNNRRTATVRVVLKNTNGELKPGMFAEAEVNAKISSSEKNTLVVPESSVLWTGKRSIVYTRPNPSEPVFELREVDLGQQLKGGYVVQSGLQLGEAVVTHGAFTIDAAAQLRGNNSMMNRPMDKESDNGRNPMKEIKDIKKTQPLNISEQDEVSSLLAEYFELKDALVGTDFDLAKAKIERMKVIFDAAKENQNSMPLGSNELKAKMNDLVDASNIEQIRSLFKPFSEDLIALLKESKGFDKTVYVQYCPMADNNQGAYWLSLQEEIRNPYFGDKMLICGVLKEQLN